MSQLTLFSRDVPYGTPKIGVNVRGDNVPLSEAERALVSQANLGDIAPIEAWTVIGTNQQLTYLTHGIFRFFGKFPPPIATKLISEFSLVGDWILDPMMGSGTTAVEALLLGRNVVARDVSPLSTLLTKVKTTFVPLDLASEAFERVVSSRATATDIEQFILVGLRDPQHWFLPETIKSLSEIRNLILREENDDIRDLLMVAFLSTVRRVSKATTQQGRLFLDVKKAQIDAWPTFTSRFTKYSKAVAQLPQRPSTKVKLERIDARASTSDSEKYSLIIAHPPYFNNYKYSSINSLELAWLGTPHKTVRADEIRESFKVGKPEKVSEYVFDLSQAVTSMLKKLRPRGKLALMMGDTIIRGEYINVTRQLIDSVKKQTPSLTVTRIVLRVPQYTEASWVASQRRSGDKVGITLNDFIVIFEK